MPARTTEARDRVERGQYASVDAARQLRWETGTGQDRVYHSETIEGTKTKAEAGLRDRLAKKGRARASGNLFTDPRETVAQWLRRWLDKYAVHNFRPLTRKTYRASLSANSSPRWVTFV